MGPNLKALRQTLRGRDLPPATRQMLLSLAAAVDEEPGKASLWREYREALREVLGAEPDDGARSIIEEIRGAAVRDAADGQADPAP
jgi:hypothetical protein